MEEREVELIDYLRVIGKRKGLIIGGTSIVAAAALVVSLLMPKVYEVSRTLKIGSTQGKQIEAREAIIGRLKDQGLLKALMQIAHPGATFDKLDVIVSIDPRVNPNVRFTVGADDPQVATQIADRLTEFIIKLHAIPVDQGLQITKEHEAQLLQTIPKLEDEIEGMKKVLKNIVNTTRVEAASVILLHANIEDRERHLVLLRKELKESRLSHIGYENTSVIAADVPPKHPVKPRVILNTVLGGTLGLMGFVFLAFFMEFLANVKRSQ